MTRAKSPSDLQRRAWRSGDQVLPSVPGLIAQLLQQTLAGLIAEAQRFQMRPPASLDEQRALTKIIQQTIDQLRIQRGEGPRP